MFLAQPEDNNAVYRCEANNIMLKHPLQAQITLSVQCKWILPHKILFTIIVDIVESFSLKIVPPIPILSH